MTHTTTQDFDVLIVGSGLAGLTAALQLAPTHRVAVITKRQLQDGSSGWAQGGIAAVLAEDDSFDAHVQDTLTAGAGLCDLASTRYVVENAPDTIAWLQQLGVPFSQEDGCLHLTREGGHSARRIVHATDATGAAVQQTLIAHVRQMPNITLLEQHTLVDLITSRKLGLPGPQRCLGLYALDGATDEVITFRAPHTILATGGAGKVYLYTTNPDTATGDGIAAAWRAGCRVANLEFIQFHPTCLYHPNEKSFLISEAVRGEGGQLKLPDGTRFMPEHDPREELAPRDIVARAIDFEMKRLGIRHVWLDITHQEPAFIKGHFPMLYERLLELGIDMTQDKIPVVPAAHYTCGGVMVNENAQTDVFNLYAMGETSFTGLHGANRMASNSLLECFVYGMSAARHIAAAFAENRVPPMPAIPDWDSQDVTDPDEEVIVIQNWDELRQSMWHYVGIVRSDKRLHRALNRILLLKQEVNDYYANFVVSKNLIELRNLLLVSELIVRSALLRHESRGLHYNKDFPQTLPVAADVILTPSMP